MIFFKKISQLQKSLADKNNSYSLKLNFIFLSSSMA